MISPMPLVFNNDRLTSGLEDDDFVLATLTQAVAQDHTSSTTWW